VAAINVPRVAVDKITARDRRMPSVPPCSACLLGWLVLIGWFRGRASRWICL